MTSKFTPFGRAVKRLLIEKETAAIRLAERLNVTPSRVYSVLNGSKPIPEAWPDKIGDALGATFYERKVLRDAARLTPARVIIQTETPQQAIVARMLAGALDDLSDDELIKLKNYLRRIVSKKSQEAA